MAVLARDRKVSSLEFYRTAVKLRKSLYYLMMRDFGAKDKVRDVVVRERRKLKHLAKLVIDGKLDRAAFVQQYESWRGDKARYNAHGIIAGMDKLYKELLGVIDNGRKQRGNDGGHDGPPEERAARV